MVGDDNILLAMNEGNYAKYSELFDQTMKNAYGCPESLQGVAAGASFLRSENKRFK